MCSIHTDVCVVYINDAGVCVYTYVCMYIVYVIMCVYIRAANSTLANSDTLSKSRNSPQIMETTSSLPCSQQPSTCPYHEREN